jgi:hypothetical protein
MRLRELVEQYLKLSGGYSHDVELTAFGLPRADTEKLFGMMDEDYNISRYFHFSKKSGRETFDINGFPQSHVSIDAEIQPTL